MKIYNLIVILHRYCNMSSLKLGKRIHFTKVQLADSFCYNTFGAMIMLAILLLYQL